MEGYVKAILSDDSTENEELVVFPITVAEGVYFDDGETLADKIKSDTSTNTSAIPNKWINKNIFCFGDSITAGGYPAYIGKTLGATITNKGSSGGTYKRDWDIINGTDLNYAQAVTFMTGHNGGPGDVTLETSGILDITDAYDFASYPDNYYGGMGKLINYVRQNYPTVKIYLLGLHYTERWGNSEKCQRALKELGNYYSVPFIDVYANCGICKTNLSVYSSDGTHLNDEGDRLLGECIAYQMMYK